MQSITGLPKVRKPLTLSEASSTRDTVSIAERSEGELSDEAEDFAGYRSGESSGDEDVLGSLKVFFNKEEVLGAPVRGETAAIVNAGLRSIVSLDREKELTAKINRPENCEGLTVPKINRDIWDILPRGSREADLGVQRTQFLLHKGITPIVQLMDNLLRKEDRTNLKLAADSFKLLAMTSCQLSQKRKDLVSLDLEPPYKRLCSATNPVTSNLFGDDLPKLVKDIKDTQMLSSKVGRRDDRLKARNRPKYKPRGQTTESKHRKPFLGFRAPHPPRGRGTRRQPGAPRAPNRAGQPKGSKPQ